MVEAQRALLDELMGTGSFHPYITNFNKILIFIFYIVSNIGRTLGNLANDII